MNKSSSRPRNSNDKIRYAVVGLGYIAQVAVLPAFAHAKSNSRLTALISDDPTKLAKLGKQYGVSRTYSYDEYDECLESGEIDAVYIALPNHLHCEYTERAARAGIHILCEKPMAMTEHECERMIRSADHHRVKLMIAYRLHFEKANLEAIKIVQSGKLGNPRFFDSVFSQQVVKDNIRVRKQTGGGTLWDIGIYCINAARYLFQAEPLEVMAFTATTDQERFQEVEEMTSAILRFPEDRLATFTSSFGASDISEYRVTGTKGNLRLTAAYEYVEPIVQYLTVNNKSRTRTFQKRDHFAPQLIHFSDCIHRNTQPEPAGDEGLIDVRIIQALYQSIAQRRPVSLQPLKRKRRPALSQEIRRPSIRKPRLIHAESPSGSG